MIPGPGPGLLAGALAGVAVGLLARPRARLALDPPRPGRPGAPGAGSAPDRGRARARLRRWAAAAAGALGRRARAAVGRPADPGADARLGRALAATVALAPLHPVAAVVAGVAVWAWPALRARRDRRAAARAVVDGLPEVVDLLAVAVAAGLTVPLAVAAVAPHAAEPFGPALRAAQRRRALGVRGVEAVEGLLALGEPVRPLVAALVSCERDGAPLAGPLGQVGADARAARRRAAEEGARRLPVQLLFPLVLCVLPAFGALTVVPLLASTLASLDL